MGTRDRRIRIVKGETKNGTMFEIKRQFFNEAVKETQVHDGTEFQVDTTQEKAYYVLALAAEFEETRGRQNRNLSELYGRIIDELKDVTREFEQLREREKKKEVERDREL